MLSPVRRRGVSELMATVIMVGLVAIVGSAALLYSMSYLSGVTSAKDEYGAIEMKALTEDFLIVDSMSGGGAASVAVYNFGDRDIQIVGMYVNGNTYNITVGSVLIASARTEWVNGSGTADSGNLALIRVVSSSGNYYENVFNR